MQKYSYTTRVGERDIIIETGTLAKLAGGAVTVRSGDSVLLATACGAKPREGMDFFPLSVDYEERLYAAGRIPGSFQRREGRPTDQAILVSRLVDRPLRPLFPKGMRNEVQVIVTALARDPEIHLDILSIIGASAAMTISDIPWEGPIGAVRVGFIDGEFVINPTVTQMAASTLDLRMAGTADAILMVEAGADELPEDLMLEALRWATRPCSRSSSCRTRCAPSWASPSSSSPPCCPTRRSRRRRLPGWAIASAMPSPTTPARKRSTRRWPLRKPRWWPPSARRTTRRRWLTLSRASRRRSCASASWATRSAPTAASHKEIRPISVRGRHPARACTAAASSPAARPRC